MRIIMLFALSLIMSFTALAQVPARTTIDLSSLPRLKAASAAAINAKIGEFDIATQTVSARASIRTAKGQPRVSMAPLAITVTQGLGFDDPLRFSVTTMRDIPYGTAMLLRAVNADGSIAGAAAYDIGGLPSDVTFYNVHNKGLDSLTSPGAYRLEAFTLDFSGFGYVYAKRDLNTDALDQAAPFIRGAAEDYGIQITGKFAECGETHVVVGFTAARAAHVSEGIVTVGFNDLPYYLNPGTQPVTVCQDTRCDSHVVRHLGIPGTPTKGATGMTRLQKQP